MIRRLCMTVLAVTAQVACASAPRAHSFTHPLNADQSGAISDTTPLDKRATTSLRRRSQLTSRDRE